MLASNWQQVGVTGTATSFACSASWVSKVVRGSAQIVVSSGSAVGTFRIEASNDLGGSGKNPWEFTPTNWNVIGSTAVVVASTTATNKVFLMPPIEYSYEYVRLTFTDASGGAALGSFLVRFKTLGQ